MNCREKSMFRVTKFLTNVRNKAIITKLDCAPPSMNSLLLLTKYHTEKSPSLVEGARLEIGFFDWKSANNPLPGTTEYRFLMEQTRGDVA